MQVTVYYILYKSCNTYRAVVEKKIFFLYFFLSKHRIRSVPFRAPAPLLPSARKTGSSSGEKGLSLSEGLGKEYMKWRKTSVGKTGAQAEGNM
jgi:hypothetical protein